MTCALPLPGALVLAVVAFAAPTSAQWLKTPTPGIPRTADGKPDLAAPAPKTADGRPDLSGLWRMDPGGYGLNIVSDLKADRKKSRGVTIPIEVLSNYVGDYEGAGQDGRTMTFTVTLSADQLRAAPPDGGGFVLVPESPTKFSASGAPVIFTVDAAGRATEFVVHTVEGDLRFVRKK